MKPLFYIMISLMLLSAVEASSQNIHTNEPDLVYPVLEEFISENFRNDTRTLERLVYLDSIVINDLPLVVRNGEIQHVRGRCHRKGNHGWIEIDACLKTFPFEFNKVLKHELGHFFGLEEIPTHKSKKDDPLRLEIMSSFHSHYWLEWKYEEDPKLWKRVNDNYYKNLQTSQQ